MLEAASIRHTAATPKLENVALVQSVNATVKSLLVRESFKDTQPAYSSYLPVNLVKSSLNND